MQKLNSAEHNDFTRNCHVVIYSMIGGLAVSEYLDVKANDSLKLDRLMRTASYYDKLHG